MAEQQITVPNLPCPNCGVNLLEKGFYNYCTETLSLREDNHAWIANGSVYVDHDEDDHETVDHECNIEANCSSCNETLPWALYELRDLDGCSLKNAKKVIAELQEHAGA
jgi:hypothetical protein